MIAGTRCFAALVIMLSVACMNLDDPTAAARPQLVVHAILDASGALQTILVYRARTGTDSISVTGGIGDDEPINGASVTVTAPDGTNMIATQRDSLFSLGPGEYGFMPSRYAVDMLHGGTFTLHVRTSSGEEVSGTTTVPVAPATERFCCFAEASFHHLTDTLRLSWPPVQGARSYEVIVKTAQQRDYRVFTDTAIAIPGTALMLAGDMVFPPGARATVSVSAVDANYYEYYRAQSDPFAGAPPTPLTGAVGVFGSIVPLFALGFLIR